MYTDIVCPNGNEQAFLEMAQRLGYSSLCFAYEKPVKKRSEYTALIGLPKSKRGRADLMLVRGSMQNRLAVERPGADILFETETARRADHLHQRHSGLNHIICRLAAKNRIAIGFSFESLLGRNQPTIMGRMSQNIALCRKFKVMKVIASFASDPYRMRAPRDLMSLFITLGMHPSEAKAGLMNARIIIEENRRRARHDYLGEGVEIAE